MVPQSRNLKRWRQARGVACALTSMLEEAMTEDELRQQLIDHARSTLAQGLTQGTSGNLSVRCGDAVLITPSGVPFEQLEPAMIARMPIDGDGASLGPLKPSSEWRFHLDIMKARADVKAVIHTHATYCTVHSIQRRPIRAVHYMIAALGGSEILCTDYAPYGTAELSQLAVDGLGHRHAVLLGNHGMIVTGSDLPEALSHAIELETLAKQSYLASLAGTPVILPEDEIQRTIERFKSYGRKAQA
jgi:L-fuculose-phosphate aldolase